MKSKWLLLTKIQLLGLFGINKVRKSDDPSVKRKAAGGLAVFALVGLLLIFYIVLIAVEFCRQGIGALLPAASIAITSLITLLFTLLQGCSALFAMKDYDLVMSLPVTKREVLASRLLCAYVSNLVFAAGVTLPCLVVLFVFEGFSFPVLAVTLAGMIFAPILPMAVSITISALLTALTARFKYKNILQSVLGIAAFVGIMIASFSVSFNANAEQGIDMNAMYALFVENIYPPALLIQMTLSGQVWPIFAFIGGSALIGTGFILLLSVCYEKVHDALTAKGARSAYHSKDVRSTSAFSALIRKEFARLFSCPAYLLNGLSGTLLLLIAGVALCFVDARPVLEALPSSLADNLVYMGLGIALFCIGTGCPSASALSLEGSHRDQLFVLPVSARLILLAKAFPTFLINAVAGIPVAAVFCWKVNAPVLGWILLPVSILFISSFIAVFGIFLNLKFPKYDWTTETQAIKQSIPVMIAVFGSMALGFAVVFGAAYLGVWILAAVDAVCLALSAAFFFYFKNVRLYIS